MSDSADAPVPDEAPKRLIVVGDRVLIVPEAGEERTNVGLYLPATAVELTFEGKTYLVVPQAAILVLVRHGGEAGEPE